jgi:hypothetical protein
MGRICAVLRGEVGLSEDEVKMVTQINPARALADASSTTTNAVGRMD